jgi:hypothetical protein
MLIDGRLEIINAGDFNFWDAVFAGDNLLIDIGSAGLELNGVQAAIRIARGVFKTGFCCRPG